MPIRVERQNPNKSMREQEKANRKPIHEKSGILGRAIPVGRMARSPLSILIFGGNRVGKTYLACQFQKPLLLVSFEPTMSGGAETVRKFEGVQYLHHGEHFQGTKETALLCAELASGGFARYKTIVIDSVTSLQDMVLAELMDLPMVPDQLSWGLVTSDQYRERSEKTREMIRKFVDLPIDKIFLAKEKDHNPPKEEKRTKGGKVQPDMTPAFLRGIQDSSFVGPELGGATVGWLRDVCDSICRLYVEEELEVKQLSMDGQPYTSQKPTGRYIRKLRIGYHPNYATGMRSSNPNNVPDIMENPTADKLVKIIQG